METQQRECGNSNVVVSSVTVGKKEEKCLGTSNAATIDVVHEETIVSSEPVPVNNDECSKGIDDTCSPKEPDDVCSSKEMDESCSSKGTDDSCSSRGTDDSCSSKINNEECCPDVNDCCTKNDNKNNEGSNNDEECSYKSNDENLRHTSANIITIENVQDVEPQNVENTETSNTPNFVACNEITVVQITTKSNQSNASHPEKNGKLVKVETYKRASADFEPLTLVVFSGGKCFSNIIEKIENIVPQQNAIQVQNYSDDYGFWTHNGVSISFYDL